MANETTRLQIDLTDDDVEALDAWIERHADPRPTREEALRLIVAGALGTHRPSTILPNIVTGRDIP
ncbi:hypothetical protein SAMN06295912_101336 [Sphingomonas laterariae]|uniref:Ribbon-helix-helix protein, copG family n=1 Tax=Edaphosphingomonas laterariae TaxID=861865 RepID=A0A239BPG2_9SPHN|nr:hypothetical protein [Sphingomonas laterariae]SNS09977.1 hypothetical protein SAMN06295912_101336 [Sphingomonas laterariae]